MACFHLAIPVRDIEETVRFYTEHFGCEVGRKNETSAVLKFFNHQLVAHAVNTRANALYNGVDGKDVPVMHFGMVLDRKDWDALRARLEAAGIDFKIKPHIRYEGTSGEQATMFFYDPSGNAMEFKSFASEESAFTPWAESETRKSA